MNTPVPDRAYDQRAIRADLESLVAGRGQLQWWERKGKAFALLVPRDSGSASAIRVAIVEDEAVVTTGLGAMLFLGTGGSTPEEELIEVIIAIMDGRAEEVVTFDDDGHLDTDLAIAAATFTLDFPRRGTFRFRQLPAWES